MKVTVTYPLTGSRTYRNMPQNLCNRLITAISMLQDPQQHVDVVITVEDEDA